nr:HD domain-containing protein [Lachnospiraceae bacterium]
TVINKPAKLTDEEYDIIKIHTTLGYGILSKIQENPKLALAAKYHHERFDGTGYPEGLKGEDIPVEARIIAVADAYDAMTSHRSYRYPLSQELVREEIVNCTGTQFDPAFAKIMIEMIDEDKEFKMKEE